MKLKDRLQDIEIAFEKEKKANKMLIERLYRMESQLARGKCEDGESFNLFEDFKILKIADFTETAISIFSYNNLPNENQFFNSKRIEKQIFDYGQVFLFKHKREIKDDKDNVIDTVEETYCLPFIGVSGTYNCYKEFDIVKPYIPAGDHGIPTDNGSFFSEKIVGVDGVIISDFYQPSQSSGNFSFTIKKAIELYSSLMADCEVGKKVNRNWIKLPLLFSAEEETNKADFDKFVSEIKNIVEGITTNSTAIVSKYVANMNVIPTGSVYAGEELTQCIKDYENDLRNFLGIGVIRNETRARKITAEFEKTSDQYNVNIIKRKQNRELAIEQAKKIWNDWANVEIEVNLTGFADVEDIENEEVLPNDSTNDKNFNG